MSQNLMIQLSENMPRFSKGQRRIAQYILDHYETVAFMTALKLGDAAEVSESTVVRFAAELGYEGYPQLQKAMQEMVRSKLTALQRIEVTRARMSDAQAAEAVMSCDMANIRKTLEELSRDGFLRAVDAFVNARKVYIFGAGSCRSLAGFAAYYLKLLLPDTHLIYTSSVAEILEEMIHIGEKDVLLALSFPRYSSKAAKAVHFAHSRQAQVVAITDSALSPIAPYATELLLAHSDMATLVDSLVAPLSILNALIVTISLRVADSRRPALEALETLWATYDVYEKQ